MDYTFPAYRKFPSGKSWFRILSADAFDEVQVFGKFFTEYHIEATIYPDKVRIADMLACADQLWEEVTEKDFDTFLENCRSTLEKVE